MLGLLILFGITLFTAADYFQDIERCAVTTEGQEYVGTISVTKSGKKCLMWSDVLQSRTDLIATHFSDKNVSIAKNYCRNPNSHNDGPWCMYGNNINDWEVCEIPACEEEGNCKDTSTGEEYDGSTNVTKDGKPCQSWAKQVPHSHRFTASSFPEKDLSLIGNKCRNPDGEKSPWCYTMDSTKRFEYCDVPLCSERLSQAEYFQGKDHLSSIVQFTTSYQIKDLITNMDVIVSIPKNYWSEDVQKKTSVWGTKLTSRCQKDLNYFDICQVDKIEDIENNIILTFVCKNPLTSAVIIIPLERSMFSHESNNGPKYIITNALGSGIQQYMKEMNAGSNDNTIELAIKGNASPFYLIGDNVVPYAVTKNDEIVMTISRIGQGRVGFMGGEYFIGQEYETKLKYFYKRVFGNNINRPRYLSNAYLKSLEVLLQRKSVSQSSLIWNAHNTLGKDNIKILLNLIRLGLNVIIGIKPWAYYYYTNKFENCEIKELFLEAGLWPSFSMVTGDLIIVKTSEYKLFPLVHLLEYAKANKTAAISVSKPIINIITNVPLKQFSNDPVSVILIDRLKKKLSDLYYTHILTINSLVPCLDRPLTNTDNRLLFELYNSILLNPLGNVFTAPGINIYPGIIDKKKTPLENVRINLKILSNDETYFLGVFVPASENIVVKLSAKKSQKCTLSINYHLFDVSNWDRWDKWPRLRSFYGIESGKTESFSNSFGGLLSMSCDSSNDNIDLNLSNIVRVPMYDRRNGPVDNSWHQLKQRDVPGAILASDTLVFVLPSIAIRNMENPEPIMELWDRFIKEQFHLRGRSVAATYREMVSTDFQIKAGYMHAGYPIGTFMQHVANPILREKYLFAGEYIKKYGSWGLNHEVGHNLQDRMFTFSGTVDVTNNVFALAATESVAGISSWNETEGWVSDGKLPNIINYINTGNFTNWQGNPFIGLGTYAQLRAAFGWEFYRQIFRRYDQLSIEYGKRADSLTDEEKIQLWIKETSDLVKMNLIPHYDYWRWPITEETKTALWKYPAFLSDDFLAKKTSDKINEIVNKYGGVKIVSRKPFTIPVLIGPLKNNNPIEGAIVIENISIVSGT